MFIDRDLKNSAAGLFSPTNTIFANNYGMDRMYFSLVRGLLPPFKLAGGGGFKIHSEELFTLEFEWWVMGGSEFLCDLLPNTLVSEGSTRWKIMRSESGMCRRAFLKSLCSLLFSSLHARAGHLCWSHLGFSSVSCDLAPESSPQIWGVCKVPFLFLLFLKKFYYILTIFT